MAGGRSLTRRGTLLPLHEQALVVAAASHPPGVLHASSSDGKVRTAITKRSHVAALDAVAAHEVLAGWMEKVV
jgi:hypothetical protein